METLPAFRSKSGVRYAYENSDNGVAGQTARQARPSSSIRLHPMLIQIAFPAVHDMAPLDDLTMQVRLAGARRFLLAYEPFMRDEEDRVAFRLDAKIHALPPGLYDAVLLDGPHECAVVRLDKTAPCPVNPAAAAARMFDSIPQPGGALPYGVQSQMFDPFLGWTAKLACRLDRFTSDVVVTAPIPANPGSVPCGSIELTIRDGVSVERFSASAASADRLTIFAARDTPHDFPKGATVQFEWTSHNVTCAVSPPEPVDSESTTPPPPPTVLEAGEGIVLDTTEDGKVIVRLSDTNVTPGIFGGLQVDERGRVVSIDAEFPASSMPVFDGHGGGAEGADPGDSTPLTDRGVVFEP